MDVTRRMFSGGLASAASALMTGRPGLAALGSARTGEGIDDAYERLVSEYVRVEEAAIAAGETAGGAGARTFAGRQLESFIADLDGGIDLGTRAGEIYRAFRTRLRRAIDEAERRTADTERRHGPPQRASLSQPARDDAADATVRPADANAAGGPDEVAQRGGAACAKGQGDGDWGMAIGEWQLGDGKRGSHPPNHAAGTHNLMTGRRGD